jgi:hypothetical protein
MNVGEPKLAIGGGFAKSYCATDFMDNGNKV